MNALRRAIPYSFYPVILLSGFGSAIAIYIWYLQYSSFFGAGQESATTVLVVLLFGLALGFRIGGILSDKMTRPSVFFIVVQGLAGLFTLTHPWVFPVFANQFMHLIQIIQPGKFTLECFRILFLTAFLFIPLLLTGSLIPAMIRQFTGSIQYSGVRISRLFAVFTSGTLAGLLLTGLVLINHVGFASALRISSLSAFLAALLTAWLYQKPRLTPAGAPSLVLTLRARKAGMLFRKRNPVLETQTILSRSMLHVQTLHGFIAIALQILAIRMMYRFNNLDTAYLLVSVPLVYMAGIALGSLSYRSLTKSMVNGYLLMASLGILTGFAILFSLVLFTVAAPYLQGPGVSFSSRIILHLGLIASLIFLPAFLSGIMLPLGGQVLQHRLKLVGQNLGKLGFAFLTGMWAGLIVIPYFFIPVLGSSVTFLVIIALSILAGVYLLYKDSRLIRGFRLSYSMISLLSVTAVLFLFMKLGWLQTGGKDARETLVIRKEGSSAVVNLKQTNSGNYFLQINGVRSLTTGEKGYTIQQLPVLLPSVLFGSPDSTLVVGFGMGLTARMLELIQAQFIQITDVFPEVVSLSANYLNDINHDILTAGEVNISVEDAQIFLLRNSIKFDLITSGFYSPRLLPGTFDSSYYRICYNHLTAQGILTEILPLMGVKETEFRILLKAIADVFPQVSLWYLDESHILVMARKVHVTPAYCTLDQRRNQLNQQIGDNLLKVPPVDSLLGKLILDDAGLRTWMKNVPSVHHSIAFSHTFPSFRDTLLFDHLSTTPDKMTELPVFYHSCPVDSIVAIRRIEKVRRQVKAKLALRP